MSDKGLPHPRPGIMDINIYVAGAAKAQGDITPVKLSSNESPLGASPKAVDAYVNASGTLERYPDSTATELRAKIGEIHDLDPDCIAVGAGSDEVLSLIGQAYLGEGDEVIYTEYAFVVYGLVAQANGAKRVIVSEKDFTADVDSILEAVTEKTRIVFLANPNNQTGTWVHWDEIRRLHAGLPSNVLLVLDAAYAEYVEEEEYKPGETLVREASNVIMTRTFSKIYGLAAVRLGWCFAPRAIIDVINRIRGPFNTTVAAQTAGIAALNDQPFLDLARQHNREQMAWLVEELASFDNVGLKLTPSVGNFVLMHFPDQEGRRAADAHAFLMARGLILRNNPAPGLQSALRMTIGNAEENLRVVEALRDFFEGA